jgi:hypothetical protein
MGGVPLPSGASLWYRVDGSALTVDYEPAESVRVCSGGNWNWRLIWFPVNFLIIEPLQKFHHYYGTTFE